MSRIMKLYLACLVFSWMVVLTSCDEVTLDLGSDAFFSVRDMLKSEN